MPTYNSNINKTHGDNDDENDDDDDDNDNDSDNHNSDINEACIVSILLKKTTLIARR